MPNGRHGMPVSVALTYPTQIADALARAHKMGLSHQIYPFARNQNPNRLAGAPRSIVHSKVEQGPETAPVVTCQQAGLRLA
jgi:hypothetical protein